MYGNLLNLVMFQSFADPSLAADPAKDKQFAEKEIDAMRAKKDEVSCYFSLLLSIMISLFCLQTIKRLLVLVKRNVQENAGTLKVPFLHSFTIRPTAEPTQKLT